MIDKFNSYIINKISFLNKSKVVIGVSGGADSMVLLYLMRSVTSDIIVAHVNYRLRGEQSDLDQRLVEEYCKQHGLPVKSLLCESGTFDQPGVNLQEKAREIRYTFFDAVLAEAGFDYICTAHHQDDNVETTLLNLFRGTNTNGLAGIKSRRGNVVRPILNLTKDEIFAYAHQTGIDYRVDQTNLESKYSRNFIRNKVIPLVAQRFDQVTVRLSKTIKNITAQNNYVKALTDQVISPYLDYDGETILLNKQIVKDYSIANEIVYRWLNMYGFSQESVNDLLKHGTSIGKSIQAGSYILAVDRLQYILFDAKRLETIKNQEVKDEHIEIVLEDGGRLTSAPSPGKDYEEMVLDPHLLSFPLTLRSWIAGDKIVYQADPILHKKVKKLFVDHKIRVDQKSKVPILVNGDGQLIWVIGLQKSQRFEDNQHNYSIKYIK